jgi:hypothetical protein
VLIRDRLSDTNHAHSQSPLFFFFFIEIERVVYQAPTLNFCVRPGLTFGMLRKRDP